MIAIKRGLDNIYIGETGPYNNSDATHKMSYYVGFCPINYCEQLLVDPDVLKLFEKEVA